MIKVKHEKVYAQENIYTLTSRLSRYLTLRAWAGGGYTDRDIDCKHEFLFNMKTLMSDKNNTLIYIFV